MTSSILQDPAWNGDAPIPKALEFNIDPQSGWPRMLVLKEETESRLKEYLHHEIHLSHSERSTIVEDWVQWQKDYWAKPEQKTKNFPFRRAANVVIPMTAIAVETIFARLLTTIFSVKPFYSLRPRIPEWVDATPNVESWLQTEVEDAESLDMDGFAREALLEFIKLGTAVAKSGYERDIRKVNVDLPDGKTSPRYITKRDGATLHYTPLANFLMRLYEKDPQTASWVGEEHPDTTWNEIKRMALSGRMRPEAIEEVKRDFNQGGDSESVGEKYKQDRNEDEGLEPAWHETLTFYEIWLSFDVDGDGIDEEIVVDYHRDSNTILSIRYNWYADAHRPYRIGVYVPVEGRWMGVGVGKQLEQFQPLITTIHRQRIDAGTLANIGMIALKKTSGYGPDEPLWPGKMWFVENPATDIAPISMSNTQHFSQIQNEEAARIYADKRSGANEIMIGTPTAGTPPTATTDMIKLAEGSKKFDMVLKNVRRWFSLLGQDVLSNYQQFGARGRSWMVRGEGGVWVEKFLTMPQADIRRGAFIELTVTDSITNKDVERQKWIELFQILDAHYDKILDRAGQVAGLLQDPTIFLMFSEMALKSSNEVMERVLGAMGIPDVESFLINLDKMGGGQGAGSNQMGSGQSGADGGGSGTVNQAGNGGLLRPSNGAGGTPATGNAVTIGTS